MSTISSSASWLYSEFEFFRTGTWMDVSYSRDSWNNQVCCSGIAYVPAIRMFVSRYYTHPSLRHGIRPYANIERKKKKNIPTPPLSFLFFLCYFYFCLCYKASYHITCATCNINNLRRQQRRAGGGLKIKKNAAHSITNLFRLRRRGRNKKGKEGRSYSLHIEWLTY